MAIIRMCVPVAHEMILLVAGLEGVLKRLDSLKLLFLWSIVVGHSKTLACTFDIGLKEIASDAITTRSGNSEARSVATVLPLDTDT